MLQVSDSRKQNKNITTKKLFLLLLLSERAVCQQSNVGVQIYETRYSHWDIHRDKGAPSRCIPTKYARNGEKF